MSIPESWLLKNCPAERIRIVKSVPTAYVQYLSKDATGKATLQNDLLENFIKKPILWRSLKPVNKITFEPELDKVSRFDFNRYNGFPIESVPRSNTADISLILAHIFKCWANSDQTIYDYILDWFGAAFLTPWLKNGTVLLLYGGQGIGKSLLLESFFKEHVYGELCGIVAGLDSLTQRFNSILLDKTLIVANEVSSSESFHHCAEKLKSLITDTTMAVERKGLDLENTYPNKLNFICTTNNYNSVKLGQGDRRFLCLECSDEFKGDYDYFEKLISACNPENAREFFDYCKVRPRTGNVRNIPMTKLKLKMLEFSTPSPDKFVKELVDFIEETTEAQLKDVEEGELPWITTLKNAIIIKKGEWRIKQSVVFPVYIQFCTSDRESIKKKHEFKAVFETKYGEAKMSNGVRAYTLKG